MKRTILVFCAALAVSLIASCSFPTDGTGSVTLKIPDEWIKAAEADAKAPSPEADLLQIYLKQYSTYIPFEAGVSKEFSFKDEIRIPNLRPGKGYRILAAFGKKDASGHFLTLNYGNSESFEITAGVDTTATVIYWPSPFSYVTHESNASATVLGGSLYVLAGDKVLYGEDFGQSIDLGTLTGYTVNSLSTGQWFHEAETFREELWLNTSKGIVPYRNGDFLKDFVPQIAAVNVDKTFSYGYRPTEGSPVLTVFYSGGGKLVGGGGSDDSTKQDTRDWTYFDLDSLTKDPSFAAFGDLLEDVTSDLIASYALSAKYMILVTPLNTFRVGLDLLKAIKKEEKIDATWIINTFMTNPAAETIISAGSSGGTSLTISCVSTVDGATSGYLFAGTQAGLFFAPISEYGWPSGAFTAVTTDARVASRRITAVAAEFLNPYYFIAALTAEGSLLVIKKTADSVSVKEYPFYSGLPSGSKELCWKTEAASLSLVVTGSGGAVVIQGIK